MSTGTAIVVAVVLVTAAVLYARRGPVDAAPAPGEPLDPLPDFSSTVRIPSSARAFERAVRPDLEPGEVAYSNVNVTANGILS